MTGIKALFRVLLLATALLLAAPAGPALAQEESDYYKMLEKADGRLRGYEQQNIVLDDSSTALTYFALVGLALLAVGLMFKSSRRTHLD